MSKEFENAAKSSGCKITANFSQMELLNHTPEVAEVVGNKGICWGLSFVWMEYKAKHAYQNFFEDVNVWQDKPTMLKAAGIYKVIQKRPNNIDQAAAACGLKPAREKDGDIKTKNFLYPRDLDDMKELANWMNAALGERFFLIRTKVHAMAASGSKLGKLEFFDPNFGVVTTHSCGNMAKFFQEFFHTEGAKKNYWPDTSSYYLDVMKFKKK